MGDVLVTIPEESTRMRWRGAIPFIMVKQKRHTARGERSFNRRSSGTKKSGRLVVSHIPQANGLGLVASGLFMCQPPKHVRGEPTCHGQVATSR